MGFIQANRLTAQTNDLVTVLNYARSEAIKRGVRVTLCSSNNGTSCLGSTTWDTGWIAFIDTNGDGLVGGEQIMQARIDLDAWYVAHHSLALDLKILARTPLAVLNMRNAH